MSTITFDFRHHYQRGERRESEQIAYQWDLGHVMNVFVPDDATYTIGYCFGDYEKTEDYAIDTKVQDPDGGYKLTAHIPNKYFERSRELRVYVVGSADDHIITTYEGFITIRGRLMPDDYVDDDPENGATHIIEEAQKYATKSQSYAVGGTGTREGEDTDNAKYYLEQAEAVAESIPEDYSDLSDDVDQLKNALYDSVESQSTGYIKVTPADLEQNGWNNSGEKVGMGRCMRVNHAIPVTSGDLLSIDTGTIYIRYFILDSTGTIVQVRPTTADRWVNGKFEDAVTTSGLLYIMFRNGTAYSNSTAIVPSDFDGTLKIYNSLAAKNKTEIEEIKNDYSEETKVVKSVTGTDLVMTDAANENLISLSVADPCTVYIKTKNLFSANFEKVEWSGTGTEYTRSNIADMQCIIGAGGHNYYVPSRISEIVLNKDHVEFKTTNTSDGIGFMVAVKPGKKYALSYRTTGGTFSVEGYNSSGVYVEEFTSAAPSGYILDIASDSTTVFVLLVCRATATNTLATFDNIQFEESSVVTPFIENKAYAKVTVETAGAVNVIGLKTAFPFTHIYNSVNSSMTALYYSNSIIQRMEDFEPFNDFIPVLQEKTFVSSYNILDGWEPHAKAFSEMAIDVDDAENFMFITDSHFMSKQVEAEWKEYAYAIMAYLEQLYYASPCSFILHGGDWLGTGETRTTAIYKLSVLGGVFKSRFDKFALLVGNHETGNQMIVEEGDSSYALMTHNTLANTLLRNFSNTYYLYEANTFHMYCFDSWTSGAEDSFSKEQIHWFAESLMTEKSAHIVIAIHILYNEANLKYIGDQLTQCADAYNNRTSFAFDGETYDFANAEGEGNVSFVVAGHNHEDATGTVNNIPYIMTVNATTYGSTTFANLPLPVDLIQIDWKNKKLYAYRAARGLTGTTRELTIL